jgi:hypothetical protein
LNTNKGKEQVARKETAANVGNTDGLDKDVAAPTYGATIPPDEE